MGFGDNNVLAKGGWVGGLQDFSVSPSPLLGFLGFGDLRVGDYWGFGSLGT